MRFGESEEDMEEDFRDRDQDDFISEEEWENLVADEEDLIEQIRYDDLDFDPDRLELMRREMEQERQDSEDIERYYRDPPEQIGPENEDRAEDIEELEIARPAGRS